MVENRMQIILDMVDNASSEFRRVNAEAIREVKNLETQSSVSHRNMQMHTEKTTSGLSKFSAAIRKVRTELCGLTIVMALAVKGVNDLAQYNKEAEVTANAFKNALKNVSTTLGTALEPAIQAVTVTLDALRVAFEAVIVGAVKAMAFIIELGPALLDAVKNIADNIKNIFTHDEDPVGIAEGFKISLQKAAELSYLAAQEIANKFAETTQRISSGQTLEKDKNDIESQEKRATTAVQAGTKIRTALYNAEATNKLAAFEAMSKMATLFGEESKATFYILKAIKAAEIIVNSAAADMSIMSTWAWNPPVAASLLAQNKVLTAISLATVAAAAIAGSFAVGSPNIPNDMLAQVHKGETIIPATFAESIRRGDLSLSGGGGGSFGDVNIFIQGGINPGGASVEEMAEQLGFAFERETRMSRGF